MALRGRIPMPFRVAIFGFFAIVWLPMLAPSGPFGGRTGQHNAEQRSHDGAARMPRRAQSQEVHHDGAFYREEHPELPSEDDGGMPWGWAALALGGVGGAMLAGAAGVWTLLLGRQRDPEEELREAMREAGLE